MFTSKFKMQKQKIEKKYALIFNQLIFRIHKCTNNLNKKSIIN